MDVRPRNEYLGFYNNRQYSIFFKKNFTFNYKKIKMECIREY